MGPSAGSGLARRAFARPATGLPLGQGAFGEEELRDRDARRRVNPGDHLPAQETLALPEQMGVLAREAESVRQLARPRDAMLPK
jgi:hypothetical protein